MGASCVASVSIGSKRLADGSQARRAALRKQVAVVLHAMHVPTWGAVSAVLSAVLTWATSISIVACCGGHVNGNDQMQNYHASHIPGRDCMHNQALILPAVQGCSLWQLTPHANITVTGHPARDPYKSVLFHTDATFSSMLHDDQAPHVCSRHTAALICCCVSCVSCQANHSRLPTWAGQCRSLDFKS
jgi:hypothetical protein